MPKSILEDWIKLLLASHEFAKTFNNDRELRMLLVKRGIVNQLPNLMKQETTSIGTFISLLFHVLRVSDLRGDQVPFLSGRMMGVEEGSEGSEGEDQSKESGNMTVISDNGPTNPNSTR